MMSSTYPSLMTFLCRSRNCVTAGIELIRELLIIANAVEIARIRSGPRHLALTRKCAHFTRLQHHAPICYTVDYSSHE